MAVPRKTHSPEALGLLNDESLAGAGASTIMRTLGPVFAARIAYFEKALEDAPADLGTLLDLRAKLTVMWALRRELASQVLRGGEASEILNEQYRQ